MPFDDNERDSQPVSRPRGNPFARASRRGTGLAARALAGLLPLATLAGGCADYRFTLNEREVYAPESLFSGYRIADESLRDCVGQSIGDRGISAASQLRELNCSHAGIASLAGLEVFGALERLKLSSNRIADLAPLYELQRLSELRLDDNELSGLGAIYRLVNLVHLDISGNSQLACEEIALLHRRLDDLRVEAPEHCG